MSRVEAPASHAIIRVPANLPLSITNLEPLQRIQSPTLKKLPRTARSQTPYTYAFRPTKSQSLSPKCLKPSPSLRRYVSPYLSSNSAYWTKRIALTVFKYSTSTSASKCN